MKTGDIFYWDTNKAKGQDQRNKYHIFICPADWQEDNTFLFICSVSYFGDFKITKEDWAEMPKTESSIGCSSPVFYSDSELTEYKISCVGRLTVACMKRLAKHVQDSETLERRYINRILTALHLACK
jgi:hypothetical protein